MDMQAYLIEVAHAAENVIGLVWAEHDRVSRALAELDRLTVATQRGYERAAAWQDSEDLDDFMAGIGQQWDTYFHEDKERHHAADAATGAKNVLVTRTFSRAAMAASVIQYAKQGLSIVHGKLANVPLGRLVLKEPIGSLLWCARNQVLHWEDGHFHKPVEECFARLSATETRFSDYRSRNMAFEVVETLGWHTLQQFQEDMLSLA